MNNIDSANQPDDTAFYSHTVYEVMRRLEAQRDHGLTTAEARKRLADYGLNELPAGKKAPLWRLFLAQFKDFVVILLIVASAVSIALGDTVEGLAIITIVILNAVIGLIQEQRADAALAALKKMAAPDAQVLRDGARARIPARELAPGDIVFLEAGNYVPADIRLIDSFNLKINESTLTGESEAVSKRAEALIEAGASIGDRVNSAFSSTLITYGRAKGVVVSTGSHTEIGLIATMLGEIEEESTPLQKRLNQLGKTLSIVALVLCGMVFVAEVLRNTDLSILVGQGLPAYVVRYSQNITEFFILAVSLAVAAVPEGLAAVVTINLALGMREMVKCNVLIRRLSAVETLGSATVICTDKTGTLTQNAMNVVRVYAGGRTYGVSGEGYEPQGIFTEIGDQKPEIGDWRLEINGPGLEIRSQMSESRDQKLQSADIQSPIPNPQSPISNLPSPLLQLLRGGLLASDALLEESGEEAERKTYRMVGDPTEGALVVAAAKAGLWRTATEEQYPRVAEAPFDAERKMMTTLHEAKGAEEQGSGGEGEKEEAGDGSQKSEVRGQKQEAGGRKLEAGGRKQEAGDGSQKTEVRRKTEEERGQTLEAGGKGRENRLVAFTKGAPDIVLLRCTYYLGEGGDVLLLRDEDRARILAVNTAMASDALRVLAVATRSLPAEQVRGQGEIDGAAVERDLTLLGLFGMIDPPRPEVGAAIDTARRAGIRTIMITGDHAVTARAIARQINLAGDEPQVVSGPEIQAMDDEQLARRVRDVSVFARVSPEHKVRIVTAVRSNSNVVAMTGDGVNDAPALKRADIGVAMGITGTDVSKETADMVLTDDNYASIVRAVEQGRIIYSNIRKFVFYLLSCNVAEILIIFSATVLGLKSPLTAIQLLWLNLATDGAPSLALGLEKGDPDIMRIRPRPPGEPIINRRMLLGMLTQTAALSIMVLGVYMIALSIYPEQAQTMGFLTLSFAELPLAYTARSERYSLVKIGVFSNRAMQWAVLSSIAGLLVVTYVPFLNEVFDTVPLGLEHWALLLPAMMVSALVAELTKLAARRLGWS
ncbi:MAG: cation-translocating P-type ATPase [Chloroflexi bacterium]|nr:cation-translocating P-type ATPase [Chloroflexota bacterium]